MSYPKNQYLSIWFFKLIVVLLYLIIIEYLPIFKKNEKEQYFVFVLVVHGNVGEFL